MAQIITRKETILLSDIVLQEFAVKLTEPQIKDLLKPFASALVKITATDEQDTEARSIARARNLPKADALHAILSRDHKAILISRDRHFESLGNVAQTCKPEELI